ncbi:MAG: hydroxymethylbilane synthase [Chloroflexota bacterium]
MGSLSRKVIIGSRGSRLAVTQARLAAGRLEAIAPAVKFLFRTIKTRGDREKHRSLEEVGGQGVFVKELESALLSGEIDLAVHSLKDVPTELESGLRLAAVLPREDPRDVLVAASGLPLARMPAGSRIGTDSRRRSVQLRALRPDLLTVPVRGNIGTRLRKVEAGEVDGIIVAAAALLRLGWSDRITEYLPTSHFLPAVGQGAIVIEMRSSDREIEGLTSGVNHVATWHGVTAERAFLHAMGGGCRAPIAALGTATGEEVHLEGMVASADGALIYRDTVSGPVERAQELGENLARRILGRGGER